MSVSGVTYTDNEVGVSLDNIGDSQTVRLGFTVKKLTSIDNVSYVTTGTGVNKTLDIVWRYTIDNYNFSEYSTFGLMQSAVNALSSDVKKYRHFEFDVQITREGSDGSGTVTVDEVELEITDESDDTSLDITFRRIFKYDTIFSYIEFGDLRVREMEENLYEKVEKNLTADYIEKTDDFKAAWKSYCLLLGLCYKKFYSFRNLNNTSDLLADYLQSLGVYLSGEESLSDLQGIQSDLIGHFQKRGTSLVIHEIKRFIGNVTGEELVFTILTNKDIAWYLNQTQSPMYKGLGYVNQLNKFPKTYLESAADESLFLLNPVDGSDIVIENNVAGTPLEIYSDSEWAWRINQSVAGNDFISSRRAASLSSGEKDKLRESYQVNPNLDYEISFWIKPDANTRMSVGAFCFNEDLDTDLDPTRAVDNVVSQWAVKEDTRIQLAATNEIWLFVRFLLLHKDFTAPNTEQKMNLQYGSNLIMHPDTRYISPRIGVSTLGFTATTSTYLYGLHFGLANTEYNSAFLGLNSLAIAFLKNNNKSYTFENLREIIRRYYLAASIASEIREIT